jgi:hypothetical protein
MDILINLKQQYDATMVHPVADAIGMPVDQIRMFVLFLMNYPIGWFIYFFV